MTSLSKLELRLQGDLFYHALILSIIEHFMKKMCEKVWCFGGSSEHIEKLFYTVKMNP